MGMTEIDRFAGPEVNKMIVGNKCDMVTKKVVDYAKAKEYADGLGIPFFETSAKDNNNVEQAFLDLTRDIRRTWEPRPTPSHLSPVVPTCRRQDRMSQRSPRATVVVKYVTFLSLYSG